MLECKGITRINGKAKLLDDASFTLAEHRTLAVLGPSGSGKSTLLRLIQGVDPLTAGEITWKGTLFSNGPRISVPAERRRFAMVFQDAALFPHLNVIDNVAFGLYQTPRAERDQIARAWLETLGLLPLAKRRIHFLSGGERQRVAMARALATSPELLLLDEPFNSVDRLVRHDLMKVIRHALEKTRTTAILVTHDARDALEFGAGEFLILNKGRVTHRGLASDMHKAEMDPWSRHFLDCSLNTASEMK